MITAHYFHSSGEAYDASQSDDRVAELNLLIVTSERTVGYLHQAWPVRITEIPMSALFDLDGGAFHTVLSWEHLLDRHANPHAAWSTVREAVKIAEMLGYRVLRPLVSVLADSTKGT